MLKTKFSGPSYLGHITLELIIFNMNTKDLIQVLHDDWCVFFLSLFKREKFNVPQTPA